LETFGDHLRKKRLDLKLLQKDVARIIGVDEASVHNWERDLRKPSIAIIPKILKFLGYVPFEITTGSLEEKIKTQRRILGLSQKALAKRLKIDPGTLARLEKGKGRPTKEFLQTLSDFFTSLPSFSSKHEG
jgi:transcriptional regulator with XRE-family HTH domain